MKIAGAALAVVALLAASCGGSDHAEPEARIAPVEATIFRAQSTEAPQQIELHGTVEAGRRAAISTRVMATVTAVRVRPGDSVRAGEVLVEIDPETARGQETQARGALSQARAGFALAERNYERYKALHAKNAASELELDMARMQYEQARGAIEQGEGAVGSASSLARDSRVVAPFAGRVAAKMVEVGDLAAPGRPLVTIESASGRQLVVQVPESLLGASSLAIGAKVPVRVDSEPRAVDGTVVEMSPGADPATHTFTIKLALEANVASGASGRAWLPGASRATVVVPADAVLRHGGLRLVAVRDADGKARTRAVSVGASLPDGTVEILGGLSGGEDVLVGLTAPPVDGAPVEEARS